MPLATINRSTSEECSALAPRAPRVDDRNYLDEGQVFPEQRKLIKGGYSRS
jgi:hypothetical protein